MKTAIIIAGDTHINSTVALSPPKVQLDDGGTYHASRGQRWLWDGWLEFIELAKSKTEGYKRAVILNGDLAELDTKRRSNQIITANKATIEHTVREVLDPLMTWTDSLYVIRGTQAHTGKSGWIEEATASDYDHTVKSSKGVYSHYHLRLMVDRVPMDIAHHASMPSLPWTEKNAANKIAAVARIRYLDELKAQPPALMFRSHNHRWSDSYDNYETRAICLPCWSLMTEYAYRIGAENSSSAIGGMIVLCDGNQYTEHKFRHTAKVGRVWALKA